MAKLTAHYSQLLLTYGAFIATCVISIIIPPTLKLEHKHPRTVQEPITEVYILRFMG